MPTADDLRLKELKQLCVEADRLRRDAEKLCKQIGKRIEQSRAIHDGAEPFKERRRTKR
jgi:hypothetical protein